MNKHPSNHDTDTPLLSKNTLSHVLGLGLMGVVSVLICWLVVASTKLLWLVVLTPIIIATVSLIVVFRKNPYPPNFSSKLANCLSWLYVMSYFVAIAIIMSGLYAYHSEYDGILPLLVFIFIYASFYRHFFEVAKNPSPDKIKNAKKDNIKLWASLVIFGFLTYHVPMLLMFYYIVIIFALPFYLFRYFLSDYPKGYTIISLLAVILFGVIMQGNVYLQNHLRKSHANDMLNEINTYKNQHGTYPTYDEIAKKYKSSNKHFVYYHLDKQYPKPLLYYRDAMMIFCSYHYDFDSKQWDDECRD